MCRKLTFIFLLLFASLAWAQPVHTIPLQNRTAEELLPVLSPIVERGGALTGSGYMLFLRASANNRDELKKMLAELDKPPRRLIISVRQDKAQTLEQGAVNSRVVLSPGNSRARISGNTVSSRTQGGTSQFVQTLDGRRAFINIGQTLILPFRQVVTSPAGVVIAENAVTQQLNTGFNALPRVRGERVNIEITPVQESPGATLGSANTQSLVTSVEGRLGEWIALGGSNVASIGNQSGMAGYANRRGGEERQIWLRVDAAD